MTLYLLPNLLHEQGDLSLSIPPKVEDILYSLDGFFVETPKTARKFLKLFDFSKLRDKPHIILDKHCDDFDDHLEVLKKGEKWGMLSDCGLPCIADPGSRLVYLAKKNNIKVDAIPGPSSIFLSIMLSGLYSQKFTFFGYFPRKIEKIQRNDKDLQVYIQTPYKTEYTVTNLIDYLDDRDMLCVALDIGSTDQEVITLSIKEWKNNFKEKNENKKLPKLSKRQAVFLIKCR